MIISKENKKQQKFCHAVFPAGFGVGNQQNLIFFCCKKFPRVKLQQSLIFYQMQEVVGSNCS